MSVNAVVLGTATAFFMFLLSLSLILLRDSSFVTPGYAGLILSFCTVLSLRVPVVFFMSTMLEQLMSAAQRVVEYVNLKPEGIVIDP